MNVTKYPPSLAFVALTLGVDLLFFGAISTWWSHPSWGSWRKPLLVFGRTSLFFYIAHLYLFAIIGLAFPHGAPIAVVYPIWLAGLVVLYPLCVRYQRFKSSKPGDSLWRFF